MNAISDLQAGMTDEAGVAAHATLAPAVTSQTAKTRGFVEGAECSALSTNALVAWVYGLVPQAARIER